MSIPYSYLIPDGIDITDAKKTLFFSSINSDNIINEVLLEIIVEEQTITLYFSEHLTQESMEYVDILKETCVLSQEQVSVVIGDPSHNINASSIPSKNDDVLRNYGISSTWFYGINKWVCVDNTIGNAIWKRIVYNEDPVSVLKNGEVQYSLPGLMGGENQVLAIENGNLMFKHAKYATNTIVFTPNDVLDIGVDPMGVTILVDDGSSYAVNTIRAISNDSGDIDIITHSANHYIYQNITLSNIYIDSVLVSQSLHTAVNQLNSLFTQTASISGVPPIITSSLSITITETETLNYELTAVHGVGYEWVSLPPGIVVSNMNRRKLIGGSGLSHGDYDIVVKAINYYGFDEKTITLTVSPSPYSNTRSIHFDDHEYLETDVSVTDLDTIFGRSGNGSGEEDSWSISVFFKPGSSSKSKQTILYYGNGNKHDEHLYIRYTGSNGHKNIWVQYGSYDNHVLFKTQSETTSDQNKWYHIVLTYDGGETGVSSDKMDLYYSRFHLYIDGVLQETTNSNKHYGTSDSFGGSGSGNMLRIGKYYSGDFTRDCKVDEVAIWGSDQSDNIDSIYNNGNTHILSVLPSPPNHWWRMGDGDTYPVVQDNISSVNLTMFNMTIDNITTDAP
jgi:hypothetical protein